MADSVSCPTQEELFRLTQGNLPGDRLESVCDHVEICGKCQDSLSKIEDPPDAFAKQLVRVSPDDLEKARTAIEAETLKEMATSVLGFFAPVLDSKGRRLTLTVPCQLGQYEVLRLIAYGGMGEVYEGRHVRLKRPVAVKVIRGFRQDDPVSHEHFLREMETAGQLEHPNLVRAYDAWEHEGYLFLAQELLDGESLQQLASKGQIKTPSEIAAAVLGTCRALEQLHGKGFVHRDVKPANIMRLNDGTIKLIDYGLAVAADCGKSASRVGGGTIGYMSPEQAYGSGTVDNRSDIYSVGRVLKYLLSKLPEVFAEAKQAELVQELTALAERLTQREPTDRLQSVYAVIVQLEQLQESMEPSEPATDKLAPPAPPTPPTVVERPRERTANPREPSSTPTTDAGPQAQPKRRGLGWSAIAVLLIGVAGFGAFQIVFKTDQQATVLVENHQPGDTIQVTSEDGKVRSVELGDQPRFVVDRGTYELSLEGPDKRQLNPASITVTGRDQLTVRIEDRSGGNKGFEPTGVAGVAKQPLKSKEMEIPSDPGTRPTEAGSTAPMSGKMANAAPAMMNPADSKTLSAPFSATDIRTSRQAWSESLGLPETLTVVTGQNPDFELEFVLIPPGTFEMGMPALLSLMAGNKPEWAESSRPAHRVTVAQPFYLSRYEVTQQQFRDVMGDGLTPVTGDGTTFPATQIPWKACVDFCSRLTQSGTNIPMGGKLRLPTEAEWEYACRAGTTSRFWSGDQIEPSQANLRISGRKLTLEPVDAFPPNPFGLHNTHGNVSEWCSDWFSPDYYAASGNDDPKGPAEGSRKVIRGGGYSNPSFSATSYWRQSHEPDTRSGNIGLRPVIELPTR